MTQGHYPRHSMSMYASKDDMLTAVMKENEELHAQLVAEAARTAEQKLRADQISKQHDMQCAMHKESVERAMRAESELEAVGAGGVQSLRKQAAAPQAVPGVGALYALQEAEAALELAIHRILKRDPGHAVHVTSEAKALVAVRAALDTAAPAYPAEGEVQ